MKNKNLVALIPARAGSKRFPGKNHAQIGTETLLERTLRTLEDADICSAVYLSTDDHELIAAAPNTVKIITRPAELANDTATTEKVIQHAIAQEKLEDKWIVLLQLTSPMRTAGDIEATIAKAMMPPLHSAVTVTQWRVPSSPAFGSVENSTQLGSRHLALSEAKQWDGKSWAINGAVYVFSARKFIDTGKIHDPETRIHIMEPWRSIDIDYPSDLEFAQRLISES